MSKKCWKCDSEIKKTELFCVNCNVVLPPSDDNHFERLNVPVDFEIGRKNLEVAYFSMQRRLHPDLFVAKSDREKMFSAQQTMVLNEAYEALKSPLSRAEYILSLNGFIVNKDG